MLENIDYQMIPSAVDDAHWNIRFLKGEFVETVFAFDKITVHEGNNDGFLKYTFDILFTPDQDLTKENSGLQEAVGMVLYSLIEEGSNDKPRTDNP
jgi:hypothetical protein|tara:strand:+ start:1213 stop:1500 length:288 start_codon:yes stop_codon:yes gene_type:complete